MSGDDERSVGPPPAGDPAAADGDPRARLAEECGELGWGELVRHFARGALVRVDPALDLVEVAACLVEDDGARLKGWLDGGRVARASDEEARDWTEREPRFRCVVAAPWVLAQELGR